ncbi:non-specific lipid-transfer protein-like [Coffea eugenioides]|uniref:non-specific lipid-transfer protein-like n=1 Tax=Coffea eugenioides TaxID=49369 RepID=UPI000F615B5F|nr:non-specific lipid-transfer protein-like [Coffea eugenioides]
MAKTTVHCYVWLIVATALIVRPSKAFDCIGAQQELIPCLSYLQAADPTPSIECCSGAQDVANSANSSKDDLQSACQCLKSAAQTYPDIKREKCSTKIAFFSDINYDNAKQLPALCNVNLNITIDPNIDCTK